MGNFWDSNEDLESLKSSNNSSKKYTLKIVDSFQSNEIAKDGTTYEAITFELAEVGNEFIFNVKQSLSKQKDGTYTSPIYDSYIKKDGKVVPASLVFELKEAVKEKLGEKDYEKRKNAANGINKTFFKGAIFDFEIKRVESNDKVFYMLMTQKQLLRDEEFKQKDKTNDVVVNSNDLPF